MWIKRDWPRTKVAGPTALTIGAFDGVHRGHQALLGELREDAHAVGMQAVVFTFNPLPRQVFGPGRHTLLSTLEERLARFAALGLDGVVIANFDPRFAETPAGDFVQALRARLGMARLWAGPDFALGRAREGDMDYLREMGAWLGYEVRTFAPYLWRGAAVRSTRIRQAVQAGALEEANDLLGRPYALSGWVTRGDGRGRQLGFPTANLAPLPDYLLPAHGIYVCRACAPQGIFNALVNIGTRPTFDLGTVTVEAYLLDFDDDLYGHPLRLEFLARLRDELKFTSAEALIAQMGRDVVAARAWLNAAV